MIETKEKSLAFTSELQEVKKSGSFETTDCPPNPLLQICFKNTQTLEIETHS